MPRCLAFLRAINVGGRVVKMDALRRLFADLGFTNVETFIASGNVIFDAAARPSARLEQTIETSLRAALGFDVATFLRAPAELAAIAAARPFPDYDPAAQDGLYVAFLKAPLQAPALNALNGLKNPIDDFHHRAREVYWLRRRRVGDSAFTAAALERAIGAPATMRNITTILKLAAKYA